VGHIIGPNSMMLEQLVLILAKCFLNSMPQPLERRKSTRIFESTWISVQRNDNMAPLRSEVSIRKIPLGLHLKEYCIFSSNPCKNLSVSSKATLTQNLVILLTSLWNLEDWVARTWDPVCEPEPIKSESLAGWVKPPKTSGGFSVEWPVEGVLDRPMAVLTGWLAHSRSVMSADEITAFRGILLSSFIRFRFGEFAAISGSIRDPSESLNFFLTQRWFNICFIVYLLDAE